MAKIKIEVEAEPMKVEALRLYLGQKHSSLEIEIEHHIESLYKRKVPSIVRDYIDTTGAIKKNERRSEAIDGPK